MPLQVEPPQALPVDPSDHRQISFSSPSDGRSQTWDIYFPVGELDSLPLVIGFHPVGWQAKEDYTGGLEGLKRGYHAGWRGLASKERVVIAMPAGHSRRVELHSLASREQISDVPVGLDRIAKELGEFDPDRVYACGLSMGGMEALVAGGSYPELFAGVVAFNPIVDLVAWYEDLSESSVAEIREFGTDERIAAEVGGLPEEMQEEYRARSVWSYVDSLSELPIWLLWSDQDVVVPRQRSRHAYALYRELKERFGPSTPVSEYEHSHAHGIAIEPGDWLVGWQLHEWCDYQLALRWLLQHRRGS